MTLTQPTGTRVALVEYTIDAPGIATFQFMTNGVDISHSEIVRTVTGDISKYIDTAGTYTFTWDAKRDYPEQVVSNLTVEVTLWATDNPPIYCAVGLAGNPYPVRWYGKESEVPFGLNDSRWKKDWLLLRQIPSTGAETTTLGSPPGELGRITSGIENIRFVRITKPFFMGVFQVTQRQWELVYGDKPSYFTNANVYAERPVERMSYTAIRGAGTAGATYDWPNAGHAVDPASFMGKMRSRTGGIIAFDLPTDAQWEYACRAGTSSAWNDGTPILSATAADANLDLLGRYKYNGGGTSWSPPQNSPLEGPGTAAVGSYLPNAWGLYDMHGNVSDACLDWLGLDTTDPSLIGDDPVGPATGTLRVVRGGAWGSDSLYARSACRSYRNPASFADISIGLRVVAPAEVLIAP